MSMNYTVVLVDDKFYIDDVKVSYRDVVEVPSVIDEMEIYGITSNAFAGKPIKSVKITAKQNVIATLLTLPNSSPNLSIEPFP